MVIDEQIWLGKDNIIVFIVTSLYPDCSVLETLSGPETEMG